MVVMKRIKYLIISLVLISACSENTSKNEQIIESETSLNETINTDDSVKILNVIDDTKSNQSTDTIKKSQTNIQLMVEINGKIYYKKNVSDIRVGSSNFYRTKDGRSEYNIKTGKYNHDYQLPHGGKVKVKI